MASTEDIVTWSKAVDAYAEGKIDEAKAGFQVADLSHAKNDNVTKLFDRHYHVMLNRYSTWDKFTCLKMMLQMLMRYSPWR